MAFPLSIVFSSVVNIVFFYLGLASAENPIRIYGFILINLLFAVFCGLVFISVCVVKKPSISVLTLPALSVLVYFFFFAISYHKFGLSSVFIDYVPKFISFCVPALLAGVCGAIMGKESSFFSVLEKTSIIVLPSALIYVFGELFGLIPWEWNYGTSLGVISYMSLAYTFFPFLLVHLFCFMSDHEWNTLVKKKPLPFRQAFRCTAAAIYWFAIIATGTRGAYVCVVFVCAILLFKSYKNDKRKHSRKLLPIAITLLLVFNVFVYAPPGFTRVHRVDSFIEGATEGKIVTSNAQNQPSEQAIANMVNEPVSPASVHDAGGKESGNTTGNGVPSNSDKYTEAPNQPGVSQENADEKIEQYSLRNRGTLYSLAWKEFCKHPATGMGALGFTIKYKGYYPHNAVLELLCETGLIGTSIVLLIILVVFIRLLISCRNNSLIGSILIIILAYALVANISGTIWDNKVLMWAIGYGGSLKLGIDNLKRK